MSGPPALDPAQAFRTHATRVLHDTHRFHLWLGVAVVSLVGLLGGPSGQSGATLGLSALQRGITVGWLAGALNVSLLVWMGRRLLERHGNPALHAPAAPAPRPVFAGAAAAAVASVKLVVLGLVLWCGWHWWDADPAGLVLGVTLAPIALARVAWRLLRGADASAPRPGSPPAAPRA